jgi:hypothetical protein
MTAQPLAGVRVLDFSTLLPVPAAAAFRGAASAAGYPLLGEDNALLEARGAK